jgi:hypothetical protein
MANPDASPFIGRDFRRGERLLVRFEVYGEAAQGVRLSAKLLTRAGGMLATLPVSPVAERPGRYQIDLPLSAAARGDFMIAIEASGAGEQVQSVVPLKIVG